MALIKCKECGNEVSNKAEKCPNCGVKIKPKGVGCLGGLIIVVGIIMLVGAISTGLEDCSKGRETARKRTRAKQVSVEEKERTAKRAKENEEKWKIERAEREKARMDFESSIESHYQAALSHYKQRKYANFLDGAKPFEDYDKTNYKDIKSLITKARIVQLDKKVRAIPAANVLENLRGYKELQKLAPKNQKYSNKVKHYQVKYAKKQQAEREAQRKATCDLELLNWTWGADYGYTTAEGRIRNISGRKLERVEALVTWFDKNGDMITSDSSLVEYDPILPGQTSPFKVMERHNPAMRTARIEFKFMWGNKINTYQK